MSCLFEYLSCPSTELGAKSEHLFAELSGEAAGHRVGMVDPLEDASRDFDAKIGQRFEEKFQREAESTQGDLNHLNWPWKLDNLRRAQQRNWSEVGVE